MEIPNENLCRITSVRDKNKYRMSITPIIKPIVKITAFKQYKRGLLLIRLIQHSIQCIKVTDKGQVTVVWESPAASKQVEVGNKLGKT